MVPGRILVPKFLDRHKSYNWDCVYSLLDLFFRASDILQYAIDDSKKKAFIFELRLWAAMFKLEQSNRPIN